MCYRSMSDEVITYIVPLLVNNNRSQISDIGVKIYLWIFFLIQRAKEEQSVDPAFPTLLDQKGH